MIQVVAIDDKNLKDIDGKWSQLSEVEGSEAVLVRPDGIVARRSRSAERDMLKSYMPFLLRYFGYSSGSRCE
jgi:hypothetical protein